MALKRMIAKMLRALLQPAAITESQINKNAKIYSGSQINFSKVDKYTYIGHDCFVLGANVGPFCSIADNCRIGGIHHNYNYVSTSPVFTRDKNGLKKNFALFESEKISPIHIGADVWIGSGAIIKSGISIGVGAVIGAGAVVTHDVPPYEIWAGNPAKKIKDRFSEEIKQLLIESKWWESSDDVLKTKASFFDNPTEFVRNEMNK